MILLNSVLVATDFSDASQVALVYGRNLARAFGANLHVLHVTEDTMATAAATFYPDTFGGLQEKVDESARHRLDAVVATDDRSAPPAKTYYSHVGRTCRSHRELCERDAHRSDRRRHAWPDRRVTRRHRAALPRESPEKPPALCSSSGPGNTNSSYPNLSEATDGFRVRTAGEMAIPRPCVVARNRAGFPAHIIGSFGCGARSTSRRDST